MILLLFLGFVLTALFVRAQYKQTTYEVESRIFSQLGSKALTESGAVRDLFTNWKKSLQTIEKDPTLAQAIQALLKGFKAFDPEKINLEEKTKNLEKYIQENFLKTLEERQAGVDLKDLISSNPKTIILQNEFLVENPNPLLQKKDFFAPNKDQSDYAQAHESFHPFLLSLMVQAEADDLLLIDESGEIFYTVAKEIDFANTLSSGFLSKSSLAALYKKIKKEPASDTGRTADFAFYIPSLAEPKLFIGMPIKFDDKFAIIVLRFGLDKINAIFLSDVNLKGNEEQFEDRYLVGSNFLMHSNSKLYLQDPSRYLKNLEEVKLSPKLIDKIKAYNSTALILDVHYPAVLQGLTGTQGVDTAFDSLKNELLIGFAPVDLTDFSMVVLLSMDKSEALKPIRWITFKIISTIASLFLLILLFSLFLLKINLRLEGLIVERTKDLNTKNIALNDTLVSLMQTQEQLSQSEKLVTNVINSMPSPMIILDEKEQMILWNIDAEKEAGVPFDEAKGQSLVTLFPFFQQSLDKISLANQLKEPQKIDKIIRKKGGETYYFELLIYPLLSENILGSAILMMDITERIRLSENVQQQDKLASIGVLTAGIAHEINNPINFITGNIQALKNDFKDIKELLEHYFFLKTSMDSPTLNQKIQEIEKEKDALDAEYVLEEIGLLLKGIEEGGQRTASIVKDLRTFSRLDESDMKKANIQEGLDSTLTLLGHNFKNRIDIVKDYLPIPEIDCFPGKLNQVFMNIISNAIQAIPDKGTIWIKTERVQDTVVVSIRDSGGGIPEQHLNRIFEPFFTTKDVGKGTGLGLSISFSIVSEHGGTIQVKSQVGIGTEFLITLPINYHK